MSFERKVVNDGEPNQARYRAWLEQMRNADPAHLDQILDEEFDILEPPS